MTDEQAPQPSEQAPEEQQAHDPARGPRTNPAVPHMDGDPESDPKGPSKERDGEGDPPADSSSGTGEDVQAGQGTVTEGGGEAGGTSGN